MCARCCGAEEDTVPEFAPSLLEHEQDLVDKMQATIDNAQRNALLQRDWEPESVELLGQRLQAAVQASSFMCTLVHSCALQIFCSLGVTCLA